MFFQSLVIAWTLAAAGPSGQIAYVSGVEQENQTVCIVDAETGAVRRIGNGRRDGAPMWSPDGRRLAFESEQEGGKRSIYVVEADGNGLRPLKHARDWNAQPRWSTDGARLAYTTGSGLADRRVAVYDLAAETETLWGNKETPLLRPVWLRDGSLMAVGLAGDPESLSTDIFTVTAQGTSRLGLLSGPRYLEWAIEPAPRGSVLAYESNDGGDREIFVASLEFGIKDISNHREADWNPVWSPDGEWVAFESFRTGRRGVFRAFPETQRVFPVAASAEYDNWAPSWSPDGAWIAFVSDRFGQPEIMVAPVDGGEPRRLTEQAGFNLAPAWRPEAKE